MSETTDTTIAIGREGMPYLRHERVDFDWLPSEDE